MYKIQNRHKRLAHWAQSNAQPIRSRRAAHQAGPIPVLANTCWNTKLVHFVAEITHSHRYVLYTRWLRCVAGATRRAHVAVSNWLVEIFGSVDDIRRNFRKFTIRKGFEQSSFENFFP